MRLLALAALFVLPAAASAQVIRTVPVTVVNPPAVQATEDVDNPAFQPAQFHDFNFTEITAPGTTVLFTGASGDPVPAGKRLVVQHISGSVSSSGLLGSAICNARVRDDFNDVVLLPIPVQRQQSGTQQYDVFSLPITMYAEPGHEVGVGCSVRVDDDTTVRFGYTGYLVDID